MQNRQILLALLLAMTVVLGQSCKTTVTGPEGQTSAIYQLGKLSAEEPAGITAVYQAAEKALTDLELSISQKTKDELSATIIARDSQDKKVSIELLAVTTDTTKMSIRAGSFTKARRIYQKIHDNLQ